MEPSEVVVTAEMLERGRSVYHYTPIELEAVYRAMRVLEPGAADLPAVAHDLSVTFLGGEGYRVSVAGVSIFLSADGKVSRHG